MPLSTIRAKFIAATGRKDLETDNAMDFFIQAGQRYLDSRVNTPKSLARYQKDVAAGNVYVKMLYLRSVQEVWAVNADGKYVLTKKTLSWMREHYPEPLSDISQGTPLYYAPAIFGLSPQQATLTAENYTDEFTYDAGDLLFGDHYGYNGIVFMPPADGVYTISIFGNFFSLPLSDAADENYWSEEYPDILVLAAMLSLEDFYRNTEGARDIERAIERRISLIDRDMVNSSMAGVSSMERSD